MAPRPAQWFYETYGHRPDALDPEHFAEYLRLYSRPGALRAGFAYYRRVDQDVADCGHWVPDEQPAELARLFTGFFTGTP